MTCPPLFPGTHYLPRQRWAVGLRCPVGYWLGRDLGATYRFYSGDTLLATHHRRRMTITEHYACDGYSPVVLVCGRFVSLTPVPRCGMFPAVDHDFKRQFLGVEGCPWTREQTDTDFYDALVAGGTNKHIAGIFYKAVAGPTGSLFIRLTRKTDPLLRIVRIPYPL